MRSALQAPMITPLVCGRTSTLSLIARRNLWAHAPPGTSEGGARPRGVRATRAPGAGPC